MSRSAYLAWAGPSVRDVAPEGKIEQALDKLDPSQVRAFREARIAIDKGDNAEAERLFAQLCQ